ncbi:CD2 antigen cytoplasmic tail-binding protein 2 homolog [Impatiens glandulifera]|uniref:CD2 antigen cytoplasmic tail-binding protein 2 homolog n=1 Tax=Impatiens glandulifera TaxID=253017 RepID=UPI001FB0EBFF|nr:CD2 antigen cytoplasmic tail-binding protein 2 homolog [Impatiens glandulifera]
MVNHQLNLNQKRPMNEDDGDSNKPPAAKRVRFPKGKKVKPGNDVVDLRKNSENAGPQNEAHLAAKERSRQRNQMTTDLLIDEGDQLPDISAAEVRYEVDDTFVDDGVHIEPFNLEKEREEGYFDEQGNYVEYVIENEIKDAWLDSVDINQNIYKKSSSTMTDVEDVTELSSSEIGKMKRRIANVLEPGETVLKALRRLKGNSQNKKEKMSAETKVIFDQLTEDAMKLLENGDYDVYNEKREVFQREAEGYELLAVARREEGSSNTNASVSETKGNDDDFDMFGEDDENVTANESSTGDGVISGQPSQSGELQNDYVYDESSGYYYSSSLGYYYDSSSGFYCSAATGKWCSYNEETGAYDEIQEEAAAAAKLDDV